MFYIYEEIPELLQFLPRELWLVIQKKLFMNNMLSTAKTLKLTPPEFTAGAWYNFYQRILYFGPKLRRYWLTIFDIEGDIIIYVEDPNYNIYKEDVGGYNTNVI